VESATGYNEWLHGEAIGAGLVMAACMSRESGYLTSDELDRVTRLVARTGLPTRVSNVKPDAVLELMRIDKKVQAGKIRLVLLRGIGSAFVTADYGEPALRHTLATHLG
jgi:3-dehydroquinate synthase